MATTAHWLPNSAATRSPFGFAYSSARSRSRSSSSRACRIFIADSRFCSCDRSFWQVTTIPVGMWVIRTADEQLTDESSVRFRALKREIDKAMQGFIAEGIADGSIAPTDVTLASFTLAGALNWPARWHKADGRLSPEEVATQMVDILMRGLAPR